MPYFNEQMHIYGCNLSILWSPLENMKPQKFTIVNSGHPVFKFWLIPSWETFLLFCHVYCFGIIKTLQRTTDNFEPLSIIFPMLRLHSSEAQGCKDFCKPSKPCHVGIHWIALTEYSQMSTPMPRFESFFSVFASFCNWQLATSIKRVKGTSHKPRQVLGYTSSLFYCFLSPRLVKLVFR